MDQLKDVQAKLKELERDIETYTRRGREVPDWLLAEMREMQRQHHSVRVLSHLSKELPQTIPGTGFVVAQYIDNHLALVGLTTNEDVLSLLVDTFKVMHDDEDDEDVGSDGGCDTGGTDGSVVMGGSDGQTGSIGRINRSRSVPFEVRFGDGKTIVSANAKLTMIEALRYMGLEKASKFTGEMFRGYRLVDKRRRVTNPQQDWQKLVDGWWIYTNLSNARKISCIEGVAEMLDIPVQIIRHDGVTPTRNSRVANHSAPVGNTTPVITPQEKAPRYSLNGSKPLPKGRVALAAVATLLREYPDTKYSDILDIFPRELQGSYGVMETLGQIKDRADAGQDVKRRYFMQPHEILTAGNGIQFAVCKEWHAGNFPKLQDVIVNILEYTLKQVD